MPRHGDPVRNRQRTASTKRRLSAAVAPGSVALPGSVSLIRARIPSVSTVLSAFIVPLAHAVVACRAAVPAVIGAENGIKPGDSQDDCQRALIQSAVSGLAVSGACVGSLPCVARRGVSRATHLTAAEDRDQHGEVAACVRYFRGNMEWMGYDRYRERGIQVGSGVEGGCRTFGLRLKRPGTRCSKRGTNAMLALGGRVMNFRLPDILEWRANQDLVT